MAPLLNSVFLVKASNPLESPNALFRALQMRNMLTATRRHNWNVLMEAASRGHRDVTEAVMDVLCKKLEENEVKACMLFDDTIMYCLLGRLVDSRVRRVFYVNPI